MFVLRPKMSLFWLFLSLHYKGNDYIHKEMDKDTDGYLEIKNVKKVNFDNKTGFGSFLLES